MICYTSFHMKKNIYILFIILYIVICLPCFSQSQEPESLSTQDRVDVYREIIRKESDPEVLAEAHFNIAEALEQMGRENEATAEYLKIVLNYSEETEIASKAEERLSKLYIKFSDKSSNSSLVSNGSQKADPAIFFTYIKSLYSTYTRTGEYDRAKHLLNKLIIMDDENEEYYEDMGLLYLWGYNDPEKALEYFNKVLSINKKNPRVYTNIALAYEKIGDFDKAIIYYQKGVELFPFESWSMYGLSRMEALKLSKDGVFIKNWFIIGPFPNINREGLNTPFRPEQTIELDAQYMGKNNEVVKWQKPFEYEDSGYVDLNMIYENNDKSVFYAYSNAYSEKERIIQCRIGSEDPIKVWVNDEIVFEKDDIVMPAKYDDDTFNVRLNKGWNIFLIKTAEQYGSSGFYFRITDITGAVVPTVVFDPVKNDKRVRDIYSTLKREKIIKIVKGASGVGGILILFAFAIYLIISNIYNKFKIRQLKEDFISSVSHELKTPIAAIKMFAETLHMGRIKEPVKVKDYLNTIIKESDRLTRFINKILDFQKIEKGKKLYSFEKVDIVEISKAAAKIYADQVHDDTLILEQEYDKDIPEIEIDEDAILQVILNLLLNAYKYSTHEKYTKIKIERSQDNIKIKIIDHGLGISKKDIERVFDRFYRVDIESTKAIKGSGIGLAFVKSVLDAHGGLIGVQSEPGEGSTFTIILPTNRE